MGESSDSKSGPKTTCATVREPREALWVAVKLGERREQGNGGLEG